MAGRTNGNGDENVVPLHGDDEQPEEPQAQRRRGAALNRVELIGRLTADPEVRYTPAGQPVANVRIATNERDEPEFHALVIFGRTAEFTADYLGKGRLVYAEGRLQTRQYTDQSGVRRYRTEIIVNRLQVLDRKPEE